MRKIFSALIVLLPFLCQFGLPVQIPFVTQNLSIGHLILIPFIAFFFFGKMPVEGIFKLKLYSFCGFFLFTAFTVLASFVSIRYSFASARPTLIAAVNLLYFCALLYAAKGVFNIRFGMKVYAWLAVLFSAYLILQFVVFRLRGTYLPDCFREAYVFGGGYVNQFRATGIPTSLFLTSEAYLLFSLPPLAFLLLWDRIGYKGYPFLGSLIITAGIVLTGSSVGILLAGLIWFVYLAVLFVYFLVHPVDAVYRLFKQGAGRFCIQLFIFVASVMLLTVFFLNGKINSFVIPAVKEVLTDPHLSSGFGYSSVLFQSTGMRLLGCGIGNIPAALAFFGQDATGVGSGLNTLGVSLLSTGIVGFLALIGLLFALLIRRRGKFGFTVALMLFALCLFGDISYSLPFAFYFLISYSANDAEMSMKDYLRLR